MMKYLLIIFILITPFSLQAQQVKSTKQMQREATKVDTLFTVEERSNLGLWYYEQTKKMNLTDDLENKYYAVINSNVYDMSRLDDNDKDYTPDEIHENFDKLVAKTNSQVKGILSLEQYVIHLENFGTIVRNVYRKRKWD